MPVGCDCTCLIQQLALSPTVLFLSCAALPYCSVSFIFPTSLLSLPSFFPLSFLPSPTILYHSTHYQLHKAFHPFFVSLIICGLRSFLPGWSVSAKEQLCYSAVNCRVAQQEIHILVYGGGVHRVMGAMSKAVELCLLLSTRVSLYSNISFADQQNVIDFWSQTLRKLASSLWEDGSRIQQLDIELECVSLYKK